MIEIYGANIGIYTGIKRSCHSDQSGGISKDSYLYLAMKKTIGTHNYYVYIITNKIKTVLYVGMTNDLRARLYYHKYPEAISKHFSHRYRCKFLVYYEHFFDVEDAISREKQIKRWRRSKKEYLINLFNPEWKFLNNEI